VIKSENDWRDGRPQVHGNASLVAPYLVSLSFTVYKFIYRHEIAGLPETLDSSISKQDNLSLRWKQC